MSLCASVIIVHDSQFRQENCFNRYDFLLDLSGSIAYNIYFPDEMVAG